MTKSQTRLVLSSLLIVLVLGPASQRVAAQGGSTIYLPEVMRAVFTATFKWQRGGCYASWCETGWYSSPAVADLDNDGTQEVIGATYSLFILDGATGGLERPVIDPPGDRQWPSLVVADLEPDADLEVVLNTAHSGLVAYDLPGTANARILWASGCGNSLRSGSK